MSTIIVRAAQSEEALNTKGSVIETPCNSLRTAKERARHYTSAEYAQGAELSEPLGYACVLVDGKVVFDVGA